MRIANLETLFSADISPFKKGAGDVEADQKRIADRQTVARIDASIDGAEKKVAKLEGDLDVLRHLETSPQVQADIAKAEAALSKVESDLGSLRSARATVAVDADVSAAESAMEGLADTAEDAGATGGAKAGKSLGAGILAAIATIPIAGAVVGIGTAIGASLLEGLGNEVRGDILAARTGLDEATVGRIGRAAGEAYASNWGASIEANMDTARAAIQSGLLDPEATERDAKAIIESITGVADVIGEDIPAVTRAAQQLLRTGLAKDAGEAFDIVVRGQQAGLNASEDWLDTLSEYSVQWQKLGLEGDQVLGLLSQGVQAGARDTDIAADALKEFAVRAVDGSETTAQGFDSIGLSAEKMSTQIAEGGPRAAEALGLTLDALREIEDPVLRDAAAVALFGTQAEDLGAALFAMDLDTATKQFQNLDGAADRALNTLGDNTAGKLASAQRNIEVAADAIQGALAQAFAPEIEGFADFVANNRTAVVAFLFDAAEAALDLGIALVESAASGTEAFGDFAANALPPLIGAASDLATAMDKVTPGDQGSKEFRTWASAAIDSLKDVDESTAGSAEEIRTNLIDNALTPAREKLGELRIPAEAAAALSDATGRLSKSIGGVGYAADGSKLSLELLNGEVDTSTAAGKLMDGQLRDVTKALGEQVRAADDSGESQQDLRERVLNARAAFIDQVTALGLTQREARALADEYGLIPKKVLTNVRADGSQAKSEAREVRAELEAIKDRTVTITTIRREAFERAQIDDDRNRAGFAGGGWVLGAGTPTSDSIPIWASDGEFVVNARAAAANRDLLEGINSGNASAGSGSAGSGAAGDIHITQYGGTVDYRSITRAQQTRQLLLVGGAA